jgi:hypothetical protein
MNFVLALLFDPGAASSVIEYSHGLCHTNGINNPVSIALNPLPPNITRSKSFLRIVLEGGG